MRPTFMGFEMCKRGLQVNQKGMDIVGNNLSNIYTEGYTRQAVQQYAVASPTSLDRFASIGAAKAGQGVYMSGVSQTRDATLDKRFREEYSDVGYYAEYSSILYQIETALGTVETETDSGIKDAMSSLYDAISDFSMNSNSELHANIVANEFKSLTLVLQQLDTKLVALVEQEQATVVDSCTQVNDILNSIAALNDAIEDDYNNYATTSDYFGPNDLLDERNYLLDQLSAYIPISVKEEADGTVTVSTEDGTRDIVSGDSCDTLYTIVNDDGTVKVAWNSDAEPLNVSTGAIQGTLDILNGRGPYATGVNETYDKGLPYYQDKLDSFATTFAAVFNNIIPETDSEGNILVDDYGDVIYKQLIGGYSYDEDGNMSIVNKPITASNICLSEAFTNDGTYLIYDADSNDTNYANLLLDALSSATHSFNCNGQILEFSFEDFVNDYVTELGMEVAYYSTRYDASSSIASSTLDYRDAVSGVSADEETSNMLLYSQSYNALSRVMTTFDEMLDKLINSTGLVGR